MPRRKNLNVRQLEAILACNQSDGYLKQAARDSLNKISRPPKLTHFKAAA